MSEVAIRVSHLSKLYRIGEAEQRHETLLGAALSFLKSPISNYRNLRKLSRFDDVAAAEDGRSKTEVVSSRAEAGRQKMEDRSADAEDSADAAGDLRTPNSQLPTPTSAPISQLRRPIFQLRTPNSHVSPHLPSPIFYIRSCGCPLGLARRLLRSQVRRGGGDHRAQRRQGVQKLELGIAFPTKPRKLNLR